MATYTNTTTNTDINTMLDHDHTFDTALGKRVRSCKAGRPGANNEDIRPLHQPAALRKSCGASDRTAAVHPNP